MHLSQKSLQNFLSNESKISKLTTINIILRQVADKRFGFNFVVYIK